MPDPAIAALADALHDRYLLEDELGRGGMATVYLARDLRHDRPVAIKVLRPELSAMLGAERFLREIQLTAKLQHPHILPLLDSGDGALRYELWRTRQSPASPELVVPLPEGCVQADVSADASRIACVNLHDDSDIYVATDFDQDLQ